MDNHRILDIANNLSFLSFDTGVLKREGLFGSFFASHSCTKAKAASHILRVADYLYSIEGDDLGAIETIVECLTDIANSHLKNHAETPLNEAEKTVLKEVEQLLGCVLHADKDCKNKTNEELKDIFWDYSDAMNALGIEKASAFSFSPSGSGISPLSNNDDEGFNEFEDKIKELERNELSAHYSVTAYDSSHDYWNELDKLVGLSSVKDDLHKMIASYKLQMERQKLHPDLKPMVSCNYLFLGNPGTGKTTVARLLAGILRQEGILRSGHYVETKSADIISAYVGQSAKNAQLAAYKAIDGLLFIDEAYALANHKSSSGSSATDQVIDTLTPLLENYRDRLCVVLAGYNNEMTNFLKNTNTGFVSRFQHSVTFENYNGNDMMQIFTRIAEANHYKLSKEVKERLQQIWNIIYSSSSQIPSFANARCVRNYFEMMIAHSAIRIMAEKKSGTKSDFDQFTISDTELTDNELLTVLGILTNRPSATRREGEDFITHLENLLKSSSGTFANKPGEQAMTRSGRVGVMMTDTKKLALKIYGCLSNMAKDGQEISTPNQLLQDIIHPYIYRMAVMGNHYHLLDVSSDEYAPLIKQDNSWQTYSRIIDDFCDKHGIGIGSALFIVGGQDIVPSPIVNNPIYDYFRAHNQTGTERERDVEADLIYCYRADEVSTDADGNLNYNAFLSHTPYLFVSRLPIEDGRLTWERSQAILGYFPRALRSFTSESSSSAGIEVQNHMVTACESCRTVAEIMMNGIPLMRLADKPGLIENNMFISPLLQIDGSSKDAEQVIENTTAGRNYSSAFKQADMLTFVLHGSESPEMDGYYGEDYDKSGRSQPNAFNPALFEVSSAKAVSGICCWGARYIGYREENSSLLSALGNNVLIFAGACRSAWGVFDKCLHPQEPKITCAEKLIANYNHNLLSGMPAGIAMHNAKIAQINEMESKFDLCTVLEFNLYGDPLLYLNSANPLDLSMHSLQVSTDVLQLAETSHDVEFTDNDKKLSLLEHMRNYTNNNLLYNRDSINRMLYAQLGLEPKELASVITIKHAGKEVEYAHHYHHQETFFSSHTIVRMNMKNEVLDVLSTL